MGDDWVYVRWFDSSEFDGWTPTKELQRDVEHYEKCETLGFLVAESSSHITVAATRALEKDEYCSCMQIPKKCILKIKRYHKL